MSHYHPPLSIADLGAIQTISDPQISPDGATVVMVISRFDADRNKYLARLHRVAVDQPMAVTPFTSGSKRDTHPVWSPDGQRIAFLSDRDGKRQVYVIDADGGEAWQLTNLPNGVDSFAWSPDGARIALIAKTGEPYQEGKSSDGDTYKPPRVFTKNQYKADGEGFFDDTRQHLYVVTVADRAAGPSVATQLTDGDFNHRRPAWSPDGSWIAVMSNRTPDRDFNLIGDVWLARADGGELRQMTRSKGSVEAPVFSPDGQWVAYIGHEITPLADFGSGVNLRLHIAPTDGSGATRCLTPEFDRSLSVPTAQKPMWSANSQSLYIQCADRGDVALFEVDLHGEIRKILGDRRACLGASFSAQSGQLAVLIGDQATPGDVYLVDPATGAERRLTRVNDSALGQRWLARPEKFQYASADSTPIDGWLMYPPGFDPVKKYPLLLKIHGGPHAIYAENFQHEFQWLAGLGFLVLYTNPRGSQGYGQDFALSIRTAWGTKDYDDIMAGLDHIIARGYVDTSRMVVNGGSYGGFMTSWIIGHTDRFRCAICERPVVNMHSFYGTSDIGWRFATWEVGGLPQQDQAHWLARSPISYVDNAKTPTFINCGDADHRTPIEQAEQLYINLLRNGVETILARYPDEPHALAVGGQPRHRIDRLERIEAWVRRHLGSLDPV